MAANLNTSPTTRNQQEGEHDFRNILLRSPGIFLILDNFPEMIVSFANEALFKSWGKSSEMLGRPLLEVLPELTDQTFHRLLQRVFKTGETYIGFEEKATICKQQVLTDVYYNYVYQPNINSAGKVTGVTVMATEITEQVMQRLQAERKEKELTQLANALPALLWVASPQGEVLYFNEHIGIFSGVVQLNGKWAWEGMIHPEDLEQTQITWNKAMNEQSRYEIQHRLWMKDGNYKWHLTKAMPYIENGEVIKWIGTTTDIHFQVETADALNLAKEQLELIIKYVPAAISLFNDKGDILDINDKSAKIWGYGSAEEIRQTRNLRALAERITSRFVMFDEYGNYLQPQNGATAIALRTHQPAEVLVELVDKISKKSTWLLSRSSPLFDDKGNAKMILNISTDITDQKQSEHEIRQSEKRFRTLMDAFPQMAWTASPDGKGTYFNQTWYNQTGLRQNEAVARGIVRALHPQDRRKLRKIWKCHLKSGEPVEVDVRISKIHQNNYSWYLLRSRPVRDENGNITQWISTCTNIQHLKDISEVLEKQVHQRTMELEELNAKLEKQAGELKTSNEDLQQFAHVASHDLKEPVRKIKTYSNRLRTEFEDQFPQSAQKYIEKIDRSSERLFDLIDGILQYSSLDNEAREESIIDLELLIRQIEMDLEIAIREKHGTIIRSALPKIKGSPVLLHQLFLNLINNALKFSRQHVPSVIEIDYRIVSNKNPKPGKGTHDREIEISVRDNGIGFEQIQSDKIFKTFTRLNPKTEYEGTGLGLALCKKIVERHNGKITAEGKPGEGSVFSIRFPLPELNGIENGVDR